MRVGFAALLVACAPLERVPSLDTAEPTVDDTERADAGYDTEAPPVEPVDTGLDDRDGDGVPNDVDLCPDDADPDNLDLDGDELGDACDPERDGDGIPNARDLFPDDPSLPGVASQDHVYPHGPNELHRLDVPSRTLARMGAFRFDRSAGQVTDVAIDRFGVLYAVTFSDAFVCHPETAECWWVGALPGSYNGLTFVPDDADQTDVLVGIATGGSWTALEGVPLGLAPRTWGGYGGGYSSSGDAFHIRGEGTFAAVNKVGRSGVVLVETDTHGRVQREIVELTGAGGVFGIGGWTGLVFAFASGGAVIEVKPDTGAYRTATSGPGWWGAGVKTVVVP